MQLTGFHHLTSVTAHASENLAFYTQVLGMRLVKKTVNQDDTSSYHLFYADGDASPGSDITFFDWPAARERRGSGSIIRTGFRLNPSSMEYWQKRLAELKVSHNKAIERDGRIVIDFEDPEGQRLSLVSDDADGVAHPYTKSPVPPEHQLRALASIMMSVQTLAPTELVLTKVMNMKKARNYFLDTGEGSKANVTVFAMNGRGPSSEFHVVEQPTLSRGRYGAGGVHHVAFRVPTVEDYQNWATRLVEMGMHSSGPVNRFYFQSLYFREPGGTLFELATDEPGFTADEPLETLGQKLSLPPFLENRRAEIEGNLKPL